MSARLLDGAAVANQIRAELRPAVDAFTARARRPPGLGIVLVGHNPASEIYVRNKLKSAGEAGLRADLERLPADASLDDLLALVDRLNRSDVYDGILVQSPLPAAMGRGAERRVFDAIDPAKDVDGFHPVNAGRLVQNRAALVACTPSGVIEILERSSIPIAGARAVVIEDDLAKRLGTWLAHGESALGNSERQQLARVLDASRRLTTVFALRQDLEALWARSTASREQLLKQLHDWCLSAEQSGIRQLEEFSGRLKRYTV